MFKYLIFEYFFKRYLRTVFSNIRGFLYCCRVMSYVLICVYNSELYKQQWKRKENELLFTELLLTDKKTQEKTN